MKRELSKVIKETIKNLESKTSYKWKVTPIGLYWEYLDTMFTLYYNNDTVIFYDEGKVFVYIYYSPNDKYADAKSLNEAISQAVVKTIRKAEYLF